MQTIEHIIVVILFIIVVIQTIRSSYFKINYKVLEELNEEHLEKIKDISNESDRFEEASIYLREKIVTLKAEISKKINRLNYLENRVKELEALIAATSLKKVKPLNTALDEMNKAADKISKIPDTHRSMGPNFKESSVYDVIDINKDQIILQKQQDEDEDQYNTTAEDNEEDVRCSCKKCNSGKDSNEA